MLMVAKKIVAVCGMACLVVNILPAMGFPMSTGRTSHVLQSGVIFSVQTLTLPLPTAHKVSEGRRIGRLLKIFIGIEEYPQESQSRVDRRWVMLQSPPGARGGFSRRTICLLEKSPSLLFSQRDLVWKF